MQSAIHHFAGGDVGALMNVSGAAVLKSSRNQAAAQKFLAFLVSKPAQEMISKLDITFEYPLVAGVAANPILKPMSELQPPSLTLKQIGDDRDAAKLSARGRPDLMSQVVGLNVAERALGRAPHARANVSGRAPAALIGAALFAAALVLLPILVTIVQATSLSARGRGRSALASAGWPVARSTRSAWLSPPPRPAPSSERRRRGSSSGRIFQAGRSGAFSPSRPWRFRRSSRATPGSPSATGCRTSWGRCWWSTCAYYPLVYLPVAAALRGLDPALEETARSLGHGAWGCFFRVVAPQLRPALYGGVLLVALDTLIEFGAFALLRFRTFTTELYAQYRTGLDGPESSLLALVLIALCLVCVVAELNVRGRARYARVGAGARRVAAPARLGLTRWPALLALRGADRRDAWRAARHDRLLAHATCRGRDVAGRAVSAASLQRDICFGRYGFAGAAAAVVLAAPLGYLATRYPSRVSVILERIAYLAQGVPGIVVALAFISLTVQIIRPLYQSAALLVVAYAILFLPFALVSVRSALAQVQLELEEAARSLGLGWFAVTVRVLAPLAGPGIGAGAAMVFVFVVTELTATLLLAPIGTRTLATEVWANTSTLAFAAAAPFAAMMLMISLASTWLLAHRFGAAAFSGQA